jgi:hypothetical protein
LELGTSQTTFVPRLYGQELALCQRYYETVGNGGVGSSTTNTAAESINWKFQVAKRATPSITHLGNYTLLIAGQNIYTATATSLASSSLTGMNTNVTISTTPSATGLCMVYVSNNDSIGVSAEL